MRGSIEGGREGEGGEGTQGGGEGRGGNHASGWEVAHTADLRSGVVPVRKTS